MPKCINHPDVEAEAICSVCGQAFCHECLVPGSDPPICTTCAINRAGAEVASKPAAPAAVPDDAPVRSHSHRAFFWIAGILVLAIIGELIWMIGQKPAPVQVSKTPEVARVFAMDHLILVQSALADAYQQQGRYPDLAAIEPLVPDDVAQAIRAGRITMTRTPDGFLLRMQPEGGGPPLVMNQDGDLVIPQEGASP